MQPMSTPIFEHLVLSKPYFDRHGLIIAEHNGQPVGFVHAGFGPNANRTEIATETGVTCMLQTTPEVASTDLRSRLLVEAETYLRGRGATTLLGGGVTPYTPFYLGLYGGSDLPGVLDSDALFSGPFVQQGYEEASRYVLMSCKLDLMRTPYDRRQRQLARDYDVEVNLDHQFDTWWDACTLGQTEHTCFQLIARGDGSTCGSVIFWDLEPLASGWGVQAVGLCRLQIRSSRRHEGLGTLLISQALKKLQDAGISLVHVQVPCDNEPGCKLFRKLGFEEIDRGVSFRKSDS